MNAITRLKEDKIAIYMCTFELKLSHLQMVLKFPCSFFVQWKTSNNTKCVRTSKVHQCEKNQVLFDQNLTLQTQMIYDEQRKRWIRKNTVICVNVITKSKPDQSKQAGRICIDLIDIIQNKKYDNFTSQPLTYCSINGVLTFSIQLNYSLRVQIEPSRLDLTSFADYVRIQQSILNKSKSLDFLKKQKIQVLQRIESVGELQQIQKQEKGKKDLTKNIKSIQDFQNVKECQSSQQEKVQQQENIRMTLGSSISADKLNYNLLIQKQTAGMKKSDLMVVPNISTPRSKTEQQSSEASQFSENQIHQKRINDKRQWKVNQLQTQQLLTQLKSKNTLKKMNSVVDIAFQDESSPSYPSINGRRMNTSNRSDKSSSIKRAKLQKSFAVKSKQEQIQDKSNKIKELQSDISQLMKLITNVNQQLTSQKQNSKKAFSQVQIQKKKVQQIQNKLVYQQKINNTHLQRIKQLSNKISNLECQKQAHKRKLSNADELKIMKQLQEYKSKCKKQQKNIQELTEKINKRDCIELQNEQKIMMLNQNIQKLKEQLKEKQTLKGSYKSINSESPTSVKSRAQIIKLQTKIQHLQEQNRKMQSKSQLYKKMIQEFMERENRMKGNIQIIQKEFIHLATEITFLKKSKQFQTKKDMNQINNLKTNSLMNKQTFAFSKTQMETISRIKQLTKQYSQKKKISNMNISLIKTFQEFRVWVMKQIQKVNNFIDELLKEKKLFKQELIQKQNKFQNQLKFYKQKNKELSDQILQKKSEGQGSAFQPQYSSNFQQNLSPQIQKIQLYSQTTTRKPSSLINTKKMTENQLQRQIQKLKSIIYDKSKEMSDLTASYQKVKLQNQKQAVAIKNFKQKISLLSNNVQQKKLFETLLVQNQRQEQFVHDILDLQIKLHKQKQQKNQIQQELSVRKSLNRSQQVSHLKDSNNAMYEGLAVYKQIQNLLKQRNKLQFLQSLNSIVQNQFIIKQKLQLCQEGEQIKYIVEQKARNISKQLQRVKSNLIKMKTSDFQNKSIFVSVLKPCQTAVQNLLSALQNLVDHPND